TSGEENSTSEINLTAAPTIQTTNKSNGQAAETYLVTKVVDGDTFNLLLNDKTETVRLIGIDTPETKAPNKPVECFGQEATVKLTSLIANKKVSIEFDPSQGERDSFGRLLLYVWIDSTFVNEEMIKQGFAYEYTYNLPYKYQAEFKAAQNTAKNNGLGLWGAVCVTNTPAPDVKSENVTTISVAGCKYSCSAPDRDCADFATHAEAQEFFNCCGFTVDNDPMRLDSIGTGDGIACESRS
ncbi:MAG TPA: thermonuclease family protein, partial [Candidatus Dojkabacteria bacterium]|nr:thermonuclease family protein [Candidatus Dojkabacteria bacterium]